MDKTPFSKKCEILHEFYIEYANSGEYDDFIAINDLGIPGAVLVVNGAATLTDTGIGFVENTWIDFCDLFGVDHMGEYDSFSQILEMEDE